MELRSVTAGVVFLVVGLLFEMWRQKLKFNRTNQSGIEQFSSFGKKVFAGWLDTMLRGAFLTLALGGLLIILISY